MKQFVALTLVLLSTSTLANSSDFADFLKEVAKKQEVMDCLDAKKSEPIEGNIYKDHKGNYGMDIVSSVKESNEEGPYFQLEQKSNGDVKVIFKDGCN